MDERDRRVEIGLLSQYLGAFAAKNDAIVVPLNTPATSLLLTLVQLMTAEVLANRGPETLGIVFVGPPRPEGLAFQMQEVFGLLPAGLRNFPPGKDFVGGAADALQLASSVTKLVRQHLNNPPPLGPASRIVDAETEVSALADELKDLGAIGLHNYLLAVSVDILIFTELVKFYPGEMKNACLALRSGILEAAKALDGWQLWSNSRFGVRNVQWGSEGELEIVRITLDGNPYSAPEVRGWYSVRDEAGIEQMRQEELVSKDLVWGETRTAYFLGQAEQAIQDWKSLESHFVTLGYC
ncbi:MAG TPA: hypothetical protein VGS22_29115 [Thermoanaerobaculia bacterium]|jgi:hypothetical protein|nr:hypothetical protein [Thermoanaerobaculia bacterium]